MKGLESTCNIMGDTVYVATNAIADIFYLRN